MLGPPPPPRYGRERNDSMAMANKSMLIEERLDIKYSKLRTARRGGSAIYVQNGLETGHELNNANALFRRQIA
jgi:hypothetical protein